MQRFYEWAMARLDSSLADLRDPIHMAPCATDNKDAKKTTIQVDSVESQEHKLELRQEACAGIIHLQFCKLICDQQLN